MKYLTLALLCLTLASCFDKERWKGFVYPDKGNLPNYVVLGEFESLESCRDAVQSTIRSANYENPDYECGLNCKKHPDMGVDVCEETLR